VCVNVCYTLFIGYIFHLPGLQTMLRAALDAVHSVQTDAHGESGRGANELSSEWQRRVCSFWEGVVGGRWWVEGYGWTGELATQDHSNNNSSNNLLDDDTHTAKRIRMIKLSLTLSLSLWLSTLFFYLALSPFHSNTRLLCFVVVADASL